MRAYLQYHIDHGANNIVLQRIYVALNVDYYPNVEMRDAYKNTVNPAVTDWEWNLAGGWRFLF